MPWYGRLTVEFLVVVDGGHDAWPGDVHKGDPIPQDDRGRVAMAQVDGIP